MKETASPLECEIEGNSSTATSNHQVADDALRQATKAQTNLDKKGRRNSSPAADLVHSHKIRNIHDAEGMQEADINRLAKRMAHLSKEGNAARRIALRERLVTKCMKYFYIVGTNVDTHEEIGLHEGHYAQVDEIFIDALMETIDRYNPDLGLFTHMLRKDYACKRKDAARTAASEDTHFGGGANGSIASLDAPAYRDASGNAALLDSAKTAIYDYCEEAETSETEDPRPYGELGTDVHEYTHAFEAFEENGEIKNPGVTRHTSSSSEIEEEIVLMQLISLIAAFLGKTGKSANKTRKLYTKLFFSETLTRITKTRTQGELGALIKQQQRLFKTVELPFQDSYTIDTCRTIQQLWKTEFIDGVRPLKVVYRDENSSIDQEPKYGWSLPASVYISYLKGIGHAGSSALVSQQRKNYDTLLKQLSSNR